MTGIPQRAATTGRRGRLGIGSGVRFVLMPCAALVLGVPVSASAAGRARLASGPADTVGGNETRWDGNDCFTYILDDAYVGITPEADR